MAKRKTPKVDLGKKITKEELGNIQACINQINTYKVQVADTEMRKQALITLVSEAHNKMQDFNKELLEKYGDVNINVHTGDITEKQDEQGNS